MLITIAALGGVVVLLTAIFAVGLRAGERDYFSPFWIFSATFTLELAVSGLYSVLTENLSPVGLDVSSNRSVYQSTALLVLASFIAFAFGYSFHLRFSAPSLNRRAPFVRGRAQILLAASAGVCAISFAALMHANGGISAFLSDREAWRAGGASGQGVMLYPATILLPSAVIVVAALASSLERGDGWRRCLPWLFGASLVPAGIAGFRGPMLFLIIQMLVVRHVLYRRIALRQLAILAVCGGLFFTAFGLSRDIPALINAGNSEVVRQEAPQLALNAVFLRVRGLETAAGIKAYVDQRHIHDWGIPNIVEALTVVIPHAVWPGKPLSHNEVVATAVWGNALYASGMLRDTYGGVSSTVLGEAYWAFGSIGTVCILFLCGLALSALEATVVRPSINPLAVYAYAIVVSFIPTFVESPQIAINAFEMNAILGCGLIASAVPFSIWFDKR